MDVRIGQIWADNDKRSEGRHLLVVGQTLKGTRFYAICQTCLADGQVISQRVTSIKMNRFKPTSTGYRLVKDV